MTNSKVLSFGEMPNFTLMEANAQGYTDLGFDGVVLAPDYAPGSPAYLEIWGSTVIPWGTITPLWQAAGVPPSYNPPHNFLRSDVIPGNIDWFDPAFSNIQDNMVGLATLARDSFCRGIFLDVEPYQGQLWDYQSQPQMGSHTFNQYLTQVTAVATAMGLAMWAVFPSCIVIVTFGYWADAGDTGHPPDQRQYGLYGAFLDGLLDSMADYPCAKLISGNEFSYNCKFPDNACFEYAVRNSTTNIDFAGITGNSPEFGAHHSIAMATNLVAIPPAFDNVNTGSNYFTPTDITNTLVLASQYTTKYLWVYTEGYGWITDGGTGILSSDYATSILDAKPLLV